jgi:hypothetical protein
MSNLKGTVQKKKSQVISDSSSSHDDALRAHRYRQLKSDAASGWFSTSEPSLLYLMFVIQQVNRRFTAKESYTLCWGERADSNGKWVSEETVITKKRDFSKSMSE